MAVVGLVGLVRHENRVGRHRNFGLTLYGLPLVTALAAGLYADALVCACGTAGEALRAGAASSGAGAPVSRTL